MQENICSLEYIATKTSKNLLRRGRDENSILRRHSAAQICSIAPSPTIRTTTFAPPSITSILLFPGGVEIWFEQLNWIFWFDTQSIFMIHVAIRVDCTWILRVLKVWTRSKIHRLGTESEQAIAYELDKMRAARAETVEPRVINFVQDWLLKFRYVFTRVETRMENTIKPTGKRCGLNLFCSSEEVLQDVPARCNNDQDQEDTAPENALCFRPADFANLTTPNDKPILHLAVCETIREKRMVAR